MMLQIKPSDVMLNLAEIVECVCLIPHEVTGTWVRKDDESGYMFWTIQCEEFSLMFTDKPDVRMANMWSVPALAGVDTWATACEVILNSGVCDGR